MRTGPVSACVAASVVPLPNGGAGQTTANTTPAGLMIATTKITAKNMRTGRDRSQPASGLFVREVFKLRGQLAHPATIVQAPDKTAITLVASHIQELLLSDERPQPG